MKVRVWLHRCTTVGCARSKDVEEARKELWLSYSIDTLSVLTWSRHGVREFTQPRVGNNESVRQREINFA